MLSSSETLLEYQDDVLVLVEVTALQNWPDAFQDDFALSLRLLFLLRLLLLALVHLKLELLRLPGARILNVNFAESRLATPDFLRLAFSFA